MQKLIYPFSLKNQSPYPGLIYRKDEAVSSKVEFNFKFDLFKNYFLSKLDSFVPSLSFQDNRTLRSKYGIHPRESEEQFIELLAHNLTLDYFYLINHLTSQNKPFRLLEHINHNIDELPSDLLQFVQTVNSHQNITPIEGTPTSVFVWTDVVVNLNFTENKTPKAFVNPSLTYQRSKRVVEIARILTFLKVTSNLTLDKLFEPSGMELNASVTTSKDETVNINCGDELDEDEFIFNLLAQPLYTISDANLVKGYLLQIDKSKLYQILKINSKLLTDPVFNMASSVRLTNEYLESDLASMTNETVEFKGFKTSIGKTKFTSKKRNKTVRKTNDKADNLEIDGSEKVENKGEELGSEPKD